MLEFGEIHGRSFEVVKRRRARSSWHGTAPLVRYEPRERFRRWRGADRKAFVAEQDPARRQADLLKVGCYIHPNSFKRAQTDR